MQDQNNPIPPIPPSPADAQPQNVPGANRGEEVDESVLVKPDVPGMKGSSGGNAGVSRGGDSGADDSDKSSRGRASSLNKRDDAVVESVEDLLPQVVEKVKEGENVLVALSNDPSVDEMSAAIALTMALDELGKHATAIYSGKTPNVLEFLKPEETFEVNTNSLQDFIIALNKDKADHLRYKIDGDYVKVFITPYKTTLDESDLEFSRGDYNVDLVVSLNVPAATELDGALREYGRIMHDATSVNITNGAPGKFGDLEWVNPKASSCSEMVAELIFELAGKVDSGVATALLTGIISATDKFTNRETTPEVMMLSAKLMEAGADQQDIMKNVSQELKFVDRKPVSTVKKKPSEKMVLSVEHETEMEELGNGEMSKESIGGAGRREAKLMGSAKMNGSEVGQSQGGGQMSVGMNVGAGENGVGKPDEGGLEQAKPSGDDVISQVLAQNSQQGDLIMGSNVADQILNNMKMTGEGSMNAGGGAVSGNLMSGGAGGSVTTGGTVGGGGSMAEERRIEPVKDSMLVNPGAMAKDYGKMIDEALAEPLPGENGAGGVNGANMMGSEMAGNMVADGNGNVAPEGTEASVSSGIVSGVGASGMPEGLPVDYQSPALEANNEMNGEMMGGMSGGVANAMGGAMGAIPGEPIVPGGFGLVENQDVNEQSGLPMPGQGGMVAPMIPMPDFGSLPPAPGTQQMGGVGFGTGATSGENQGMMFDANGGNMPETGTMMGGGAMGANGMENGGLMNDGNMPVLPQVEMGADSTGAGGMNQMPVGGGQMTPEAGQGGMNMQGGMNDSGMIGANPGMAPADPGAFKIPGM
ncbi:hypothetical protein IKF81_03015 [Candidatus Saccharibacteria bacterium]|nr:hypothetical protein [Candidatus Saccharibacteria bacterium]